MTAQEKGTQLRVGIFMAIGIAFIAAMVVYFGRFGEAFRGYYEVSVVYPNASGIYKGADVLLSGAKVGSVVGSPVILPEMDGVTIKVQLYDDVKIPSGAVFTIGSSGLLGDKFVQVNVKKDAKDTSFIEPGATIKGKGEAGLGELTEQVPEIMASAKETIDDIHKAVGSIKEAVDKLNTNMFKETTMQDLNSTIANLKTTSESFAVSAKKIDGVIEKADSAIGVGKETFTSAKSAADELQKAISDIRNLLAQAKQGRGALGVLLSDKQTADNLRALVANLRQYGVLWYKDKAAQPSR